MIKLLFLALVILLGIHCQTNIKRDVFLIPKDYQGPVVVLFDEPTGDSIVEDGKRVFTIKADGICKTKFSAEFDKLTQNFFLYFDSPSHSDTLNYLWGNSKPVDSSVVFCFLMEPGGGNDVNHRKREFFRFYVSNLFNIDSVTSQGGKLVDKALGHYFFGH